MEEILRELLCKLELREELKDERSITREKNRGKYAWGRTRDIQRPFSKNCTTFVCVL